VVACAMGSHDIKTSTNQRKLKKNRVLKVVFFVTLNFKVSVFFGNVVFGMYLSNVVSM